MTSNTNIGVILSNDVLKEAFQTKHIFVVSSLRADHVMQHMFSAKILTTDDIAELEHITRPTDQCKTFLFMLHKSKHPETFAILLNSLKESQVDYKHIVRCITDECEKILGLPKDLKLVHSFPEKDKPVYGITTLNKELYVRYGGQRDFAVYDTEKFSLQRRLSVEGVSCVSDMASCEKFQCIYIADNGNKVIYRVEPKANNIYTKWSVQDEPESLSVNSEHNVIVTFWQVYKIKVFTTHGDLVKEINLGRTDIAKAVNSQQSHIKHAIQLTTDQYVVSQGDYNSWNRVLIVGDTGLVKESFGSEAPGANEDQLDYPLTLVAVRKNFIFVADHKNKRLVLLSSTLRYIRRWNLNGEPWRMCFDEQNDRLYVCVHESSSRAHVEVYIVSY